MRELRILDVFPGHFNINGDGGNILALRRRLEWSGISVEVHETAVGESWPAEADLVHIGGGTAAAQRAAVAALRAEADRISDWVADGVPLLAIAGGFQLAVERVRLPGEGDTVEGLGLFAGESRPTAEHDPGPVVGRHPELGWVAGFQNLAQSVELGAGQAPFLEVHHGRGNEFSPGEGAVTGTAIGTRLHGPLLPKNPQLADHLIRQALRRRGAEEAYRHGEQHRLADGYAAQAWRALRERVKLRLPDGDETQPT